MKEFSELGAGFRIAALDLELRGAGNMLGRQQHGHIEAIGFDIYCADAGARGLQTQRRRVAPELRTTLSLGFDVRIPQDYIPSENLRLRTYKRISSIKTEDEKRTCARNWKTASAPLPASVENLLEYAALKSICERLRISIGGAARRTAWRCVFTRRRRWTPRHWYRWCVHAKASSWTLAACCGWRFPAAKASLQP